MKKEIMIMTPVQALRQITGIFSQEHAIHILAFANLLARKLDNCPMLDDEFLKDEFLKIGIELEL